MLGQLAATLTINGTTSTIDDGDFLALFGAFFAAIFIPLIIVWILLIIAQWKIFEKAGYEGWKAIIPFYNMYILTEISGQNGWLFLLCLIPGVGALIWEILVAIKLAPAFGKDTGFAIGLIFLGPIFQMILGFGQAEYVLGKPAAKASATESSHTPKAAAKKKASDPWVEGKK